MLPSPNSAIIVSDFANIEDLVKYIQYLDRNDEEYNKYLSFKRHGVSNPYLQSLLQKREWGVYGEAGKPNMIDAFECLVCKRVNENLERESKGLQPVLHHASKEHYGCAKPLTFADVPRGSLRRVDSKWWGMEWTYNSFLAKSLRIFLDRELNFTARQVEILASALKMRNHEEY